MAISESNTARCQQMMAEQAFYRALRTVGQRALFAHMIERADNDVAYAADLSKWIAHGSTLLLRDLAQPFGDYWRDLVFANVIDALDSVRASYKAAA